MRLKLLSPFRIDAFIIHSQAPVVDAKAYGDFWEEFATDKDGANALGEGVAALFTHATRFTESGGTRYDRIDIGTLKRPLHALELQIDASALGATGCWKEACRRIEKQGDGEAESDADLPWTAITDGVRKRIEEGNPKVCLRIFGSGIGILETDLALDSLLQTHRESASIEDVLHRLQEVGIAYAAALLHESVAHIQALLKRVRAHREARAWLDTQALDPDSLSANAMWVTRSLIFEESEAAPDFSEFRDTVIEFWLRDVGSGKESDALLKDVKESSQSYCLKWLNYLVRENAYPKSYPKNGWTYDERGAATPFFESWEAMLYSQYYYAAFEAQGDTLHEILADAFDEQQGRKLVDLREDLDRVVKDSTLLIQDYRSNFRYYSRDVAAEMRQIIGYWGLEDIIETNIQKSIQACQDRLEVLHERASQTSTFYTELILLAIGMTSVFGILLQLTSYGRTLAGDADLAVYDGESSWNFINWVASHSTNTILVLSTVISILLLCLYVIVRRRNIGG